MLHFQWLDSQHVTFQEKMQPKVVDLRESFELKWGISSANKRSWVVLLQNLNEQLDFQKWINGHEVPKESKGLPKITIFVEQLLFRNFEEVGQRPSSENIFTYLNSKH